MKSLTQARSALWRVAVSSETLNRARKDYQIRSMLRSRALALLGLLLVAFATFGLLALRFAMAETSKPQIVLICVFEMEDDQLEKLKPVIDKLTKRA